MQHYCVQNPLGFRTTLFRIMDKKKRVIQLVTTIIYFINNLKSSKDENL